MLFLLKRSWLSALLAGVLLAVLGLGLRRIDPESLPPIDLTWHNVLLGVVAVGGVLFCDGLIHGLSLLTFGDRYRRRHRELAGVFRGQGLAAILAGALMAGVGEELVFRGASTDLRYLIPAAVVFGLLHHVRRDLWPFTVWAVWQGLLFVLALRLCGNQLVVTMTGHFLHDFLGFLIFRWLNGRLAA